ncbi:MAG TPA: permease prefix domain 1-containing protein, partial [Marmoricola sp.]|nr:permease prefix domain 1-containing protein [Marmoricola sp.]
MEQIERYLDELSTRLRIGPDRTRRFLAEAEEHLHEAVAQEVAAGADAEAAERRAIERFGTVREVSAAANGSLITRLESLALGGAYLGVAGSLAVLAGTLLARLVAVATSASTTFGPPPGFLPTRAQVDHWLALHPTAHSWYAAATSENADDTLLLRSAFALLGLVVSLVVLRVLRRRTSPPAGGVVPAIGMTA